MGDARPTSSESILGRTIAGKYEIISLLGRGGMGSVYKARQPTLKRSVAIKVLAPQHAKDKTYVSRFKREALAACRLDHANLMRVLDVGEEPDGLLYMVMELLNGRNLAQIIHDGPVPANRIVEIMSQTLAAVAAAHEQGVLHRDLKPENIMIMRGRDDEGHDADMVKVCDFGIAKLVGLESTAQQPEGVTFTATLTATGALVGTPEYMSPEQARGDPVDARSDLYALGIILYEMLAGRVPFTSNNSMKVLLQHAAEEPPPPSKYNPNADPTLVELCLHAIRKDAKERFATAREFRAALRADRDLRERNVAAAAGPPSSMLPVASRRSGVESTTPSSPPSPRPSQPTHDREAATLASIPAPPAGSRSSNPGRTMSSGPPPPNNMPPGTPTLATKPAAQNRTTVILLAVIVALLIAVALLVRR